MSISALLSAYQSGQKTCTQETEERLAIIAQKEPEVGALITVCEDSARQDAKACDDARDFSLPLAGIPATVKDVICTSGVRTTAASRMLEHFVPPYDATVVQKIRDAGAIMLGKNNCDEFANGSSNENSALKECRNPQNTDLVPGGSSGGSAASVAAGECLFSLGTDTGGSIRFPANFCGVVGLKPTYGRVSRYGALSYASSFDTIGPLTRNVEDSARVLEVIAGKDEKDATTLDAPVPKYSQSLSADIAGKKVGLVKEYMEADGLDPRMKQMVQNAAEQLKERGAQIVEVSLPLIKYSIATYYILVKAEGSTNYARYDGIRFGHLSPEAHNLPDTYSKTRSEGFGDEIKRCLMMGTYTLSAGYYDAYYLKAAKVRTLIKEEYEKILQSVDVLLTPVSPCLPFAFGEKSDPLQMYLVDLFTVTPSLAGGCALSVPTETIDGIRTGVQIMGPQLGEEKILNFGWHLEQAYQE